MIKIFTKVINLTDTPKPVAQGMGAGNVYWVTIRARTNGFSIATSVNAIDGFRVPADEKVNLPITDMGNKFGVLNLDDLYWFNTVPATVAVVEILGMREV